MSDQCACGVKGGRCAAKPKLEVTRWTGTDSTVFPVCGRHIGRLVNLLMTEPCWLEVVRYFDDLTFPGATWADVARP